MKNLQTISSSNSQEPETPTTASTIKRSTQSLSSLEKLESSYMGILEGTLQEIKKTPSHEERRTRRGLKSPTDWSMNSDDLSDLRQELDQADSVYSRRTSNSRRRADATFGDDFSDDSEDLMVGSFQPISASFDDEPEFHSTSHVPPSLHINTSIQNTRPNKLSPQGQSVVNDIPSKDEALSDEKITGPNAVITPSHKTEQPEDESKDATSPDSNAVPHEVFVPKGSPASTSGTRTVPSTTARDAEQPSTTSQSDPLTTALSPTPANVRASVTVSEIHPISTISPQAVRRHSSYSMMIAQSSASFLKSSQSKVRELVEKHERKRLHLEATIDSVRNNNHTVDSRLVQALTEKENLQQEMEAEKIAHKQTTTNLKNKLKFWERQHGLQTEREEGFKGDSSKDGEHTVVQVHLENSSGDTPKETGGQETTASTNSGLAAGGEHGPYESEVNNSNMNEAEYEEAEKENTENSQSKAEDKVSDHELDIRMQQKKYRAVEEKMAAFQTKSSQMFQELSQELQQEKKAKSILEHQLAKLQQDYDRLLMEKEELYKMNKLQQKAILKLQSKQRK